MTTILWIVGYLAIGYGCKLYTDYEMYKKFEKAFPGRDWAWHYKIESDYPLIIFLWPFYLLYNSLSLSLKALNAIHYSVLAFVINRLYTKKK